MVFKGNLVSNGRRVAYLRSLPRGTHDTVGNSFLLTEDYKADDIRYFILDETGAPMFAEQ